MKSKGLYLILAVVLGLIQITLTIGLKTHASGGHSLITYLIIVILLVVMFMVGRLTKKKGGSPLWMGALTGGIYGLIAGLGSFFVKVDASKFQNAALTAQQITKAVKYANSPVAHLMTDVVSIIIFGVIGLVVGIIGGSTAKRENPTDTH